MFNRILVPLDGSTLAERAIPHAEAFARIFGASIILLQVLEPTSFHENPTAVDPLSWQIHKAEAELYMQAVAARIRENIEENTDDTLEPQTIGQNQKISRVEYAIREGKIAENIVNFAHSENIDLLVLSTHGAGGLSSWNISSIAQKVVNQVYLPVLIVRAYQQSYEVNDRVHYRSILLPIDSSRRAECSLPAGIALARGEASAGLVSTAQHLTLQTKVILAAVIKPPELPIPEPYPGEIEDLSNQLMQVSRLAVTNYLNEMKERLPVACDTRVLEHMSVSYAIQDLAGHDDEIDLVVLCAHGYSGQYTWPYGSIARNYIDHGTKPVLIIQDVALARVQPTAAELAAEKSGRR